MNPLIYNLPLSTSDAIPSFSVFFSGYRIFMIAVALIMTYVIDSFAMSLRAVSIQTRKWTTSFANKFSNYLINASFVTLLKLL